MKVSLISEKIRPLKALILDVDGVLTDGGIYVDASGHEIKRFYAQDGSGVKQLQSQGIVLAVISGRFSHAVTYRMQELGIVYVYQNIENKLEACEKFKQQLQFENHQLAFMGDDLPDLPLLKQVGLSIAPQNAVAEVKHHAHWVTNRSGGHGAVREVTDFMLHALTLQKDAATR